MTWQIAGFSLKSITDSCGDNAVFQHNALKNPCKARIASLIFQYL